MSGISKKDASREKDCTETFINYTILLVRCRMTKINNQAERDFVSNYFTHNEWDYQPPIYLIL